MQNDTNIFDVVVIGSGPAGSATAIHCAKQGLNVCMIESAESRRQKPGESFHPGIFSLLKVLGVHDKIPDLDFLEYNGQFVNWGDHSGFQGFGWDGDKEIMGVHASRQLFEEMLLAEAVNLGVTFKCACHAISVMFQDGRVTGIKSSCGPIFGKYTVDATGGRHWLSKQITLPIQYESKKLIAVYGYTDAAGQADQSSSFLEAGRYGWTWTARIEKNKFAWTSLNLGSSKVNPKEVPQRLRNCNQIGSTGGADVTWRLSSQSAGSGYFIAGDAAAVLDPLSSDGVIRALLTGIFASHCMNKIIREKIPENYVTESYKNWTQQLFNHKASSLRSLYHDHFNYNILAK